jgi:hypothetical protein
VTVHTYSGPAAVYPFLATGDPETPRIAPFSVNDGDSVDFGDCAPPADTHWSPAEGSPVAVVADPDRSDVIELAEPEPEVEAEPVKPALKAPKFNATTPEVPPPAPTNDSGSAGDTQE